MFLRCKTAGSDNVRVVRHAHALTILFSTTAKGFADSEGYLSAHTHWASAQLSTHTHLTTLMSGSMVIHSMVVTRLK